MTDQKTELERVFHKRIFYQAEIPEEYGDPQAIFDLVCDTIPRHVLFEHNHIVGDRDDLQFILEDFHFKLIENRIIMEFTFMFDSEKCGIDTPAEFFKEMKEIESKRLSDEDKEQLTSKLKIMKAFAQKPLPDMFDEEIYLPPEFSQAVKIRFTLEDIADRSEDEVLNDKLGEDSLVSNTAPSIGDFNQGPLVPVPVCFVPGMSLGVLNAAPTQFFINDPRLL